MYIVIVESPGNPPAVSLFEDLGHAEGEFSGAELDKCTNAVHLVAGTPGSVFGCKPVKSRWVSDGEETVWIQPS